MERICPVCGKDFWSWPQHVYKRIRGGNEIVICSWKCLRKYDEEHTSITGKGLSERKPEIIAMVKAGMNSVEIGKQMEVAPPTIRYHINKLKAQGKL